VSRYDVAIIGGGINGVGIARDLSIRGFKVILFEKEDFGWATTWSSSCMVHGGARYIIHDIGVTYKSSRDAGILTKIVPYMLSRRPFIVVTRSKFMAILFDIYMGVYDLFSRMRGAVRHMRLTPDEVSYMTAGEVLAKGGGVLTEEYTVDPQRLALVNAISAQEFGAKVLNHTEVIRVERKDGSFLISAKNLLYNSEIKVESKLVVNASGPWIDKVIANSIVGTEQRKKKRLRPTKGIHIVFPGKILNSVISFQAIDGRYLLFVPLEDRTILGTTDDDFFGDPDDIEILRDEVEYLLHSAEKFIKNIRGFKPYSTKVGLRPTPYVYGVNEDKITREFEIEYDDGIIHVLGGKLASFRLLSEIVSDFVSQKLGIKTQCKTHILPLPGADDIDERFDGDFEAYSENIKKKIKDEFSLDDQIAYLLTKKYGIRARELLKTFGLGELICYCSKVFEGEVRWAIKREFAETIDDISRRTWACDGFCNGILCMRKVQKILEAEGKNPDHKNFVLRREKLLYPVKKYNEELWNEFEEFKKKVL
jgi:glycerol-3-phosphate dehydrogenase